MGVGNVGVGGGVWDGKRGMMGFGLEGAWDVV